MAKLLFFFFLVFTVAAAALPGDEMVVLPLMVGVLGDGMIDKRDDRWQLVIGELLGDEEDEMYHPLTLIINPEEIFLFIILHEGTN
ncbi:hypothetical protein QVD17_03583 [Tagetes erecta]|uniref:Uncharacterized protein n=1 Tax=Tagetes erecta TaxID=13708 RepID=A0AAD8LHS7_TARER|nr:hypothetical protein QVD17_03583 [Tagetes erecta]